MEKRARRSQARWLGRRSGSLPGERRFLSWRSRRRGAYEWGRLILQVRRDWKQEFRIQPAAIQGVTMGRKFRAGGFDLDINRRGVDEVGARCYPTEVFLS